MHRWSGIYTAVIVQKDGFGTMEGGSGTVCLGGLPGLYWKQTGFLPKICEARGELYERL